MNRGRTLIEKITYRKTYINSLAGINLDTKGNHDEKIQKGKRNRKCLTSSKIDIDTGRP